MVFRRDNKVDAFQRQMSALRQQIGGNAGEERDDVNDNMPELDDERYVDNDAYATQGGYAQQDSGGYSFGSYPSQDVQATDTPTVDDSMPQLPEMPVADAQISIIAKDTFWKGDLESEGSTHVYGRFEGTLRAQDDIWVAEGAEVNATLQARRVIIAGMISGSIRASDRFEALPQGQIEADVVAPTFVVHEGASINGQLKMGAADGNGDTRSERGGAPAIIQRRARTGA